MFTGIIEEMGTVTTAQTEGGGRRLTIEAPRAASELKVNESVSVSGVCLTVIDQSGSSFTVQAVEETLKKTTLVELKGGSPVNLELPVRLNDRLGGHLVQGHVDTVGIITGVEKKESSWLMIVEFPKSFSRYVIPVGSIAIDGISLTVASVEDNCITVSVIPHTLEKTTLSAAQKGVRVNLEFDLIGKYVQKLMTGEASGDRGPTLTVENLRTWGYKV